MERIAKAAEKNKFAGQLKAAVIREPKFQINSAGTEGNLKLLMS